MEDRTQLISGATVLGGAPTMMGGMPAQSGFDPTRTAMAGSMQTLEVECLAGNRYAMAPEISRDHALIVVKASGQQLGRRAPINVCLVIDRSGSMEGDPIEYVKRACEYVVDMLRAQRHPLHRHLRGAGGCPDARAACSE